MLARRLDGRDDETEPDSDVSLIMMPHKRGDKSKATSIESLKSDEERMDGEDINKVNEGHSKSGRAGFP